MDLQTYIFRNYSTDIASYLFTTLERLVTVCALVDTLGLFQNDDLIAENILQYSDIT
jgi:hypothetical protein